MDAEVKGLFWNLAAITFIAISVVSGIAFFATTALQYETAQPAQTAAMEQAISTPTPPAR